MMQKFLATLFVALLSAAAFAGGMEALDADGSGTISQEEAQADPMLVEKWGEIDVNQDGQVDSAEFAQFEATAAPAEGQ